MIKRLAITTVLVFSYLSASAQIATPMLNRTANVQSSAAAGWRDVNTVGLQAVSAKGNHESGAVELGEITIGGTIPAVVVALKGEAIGLEMYASTDKTKKYKSSVAPFEQETKLPETRLNLAYVFGEALSVGLGYRTSEDKVDITTPLGTSSSSQKRTGLMVSASLKLADIFYVAGGMENVDLKLSPIDQKNAWSNTILGLGVVVGDFGESRFRAEYSIIQSPEKNEAQNIHFKTDQSIMSLEAQFGDFLLSYISETHKQSDVVFNPVPLVTGEDKTVTSQMGLGWMPKEGLSVAAYMVDVKRTLSPAVGSEETFTPKGYRLDVGWSF